MIKNNTHFDRKEQADNNYYNNIRGTQTIGGTNYEGYFKCKLVHTKGLSVIVPDLIYIMDDNENFTWFQFYSFMPNQLIKFGENEILGSIYVDIAFGHTLRLTISNEWHVENFQDQSNLFKCRITGPDNLMDYSTGKGKLINKIPFIYLYHHTLPETKKLIIQSSNYRGSLWNYQGTKTLTTICYAYFTSLDAIQRPNDLKMIAMANEGELQLMVDVSKEIVPITVYRDNTENRTATIKQLIDTTIILNNHIWIHTHDHNGTTYYELCSAFIYRVGLEPNTILPFENETIFRVDNVKITNYIILGDSTTKLGLLAPFDEEFTTHIFKIEPFYNINTNILKFWFNNGNKDHYSEKKLTGRSLTVTNSNASLRAQHKQ
ncbi:hypothetical protein D3C72_906790 [compost metagenome]